MPVTEAQVREALRPVQDPELHRSIVDLDMVRTISIDGGRVAVTVALTVAGCPLRNEITNRVTGAVDALDGVDAVDLDFTVMTDDERAALRTKLHGDPAATAGTHVRNILNKTNTANRTEAAAYATQHGLRPETIEWAEMGGDEWWLKVVTEQHSVKVVFSLDEI